MLMTKTAQWIGETAVALGATVLLAGCASSGATVANPGAPGKAATGSTAPAPLPACYVDAVPKADRFRNGVYYRLMLGDGLRLVPPQKLFERMTVAAEAGENYKALYLARVLTEIAPDNAGAWENRRRLAGSLGLSGEREAAQKRAASPSTQATVPSEFLPGWPLPARPVSLADWAGAMNLMADDVASREGHGAIVAIKDDVSGVSTLARADGTPYTIAAPLRLDDLLSNAFELRDVHAMQEHNTNGGWLATGMLLSALAGANAGLGNAAAAQQGSEAAAAAMAESGKVACHYKGGAFTARTFPNGQARDASQKPQPAGAREAIDTPTALVWLSGGSMSPAVLMRVASSSGGQAKTYVWDFHKGKQDRVRVPDLSYPRLSLLCADGGCTVPLSVMELMLNADDLRAFFDGNANLASVVQVSFDMSRWNQRYATSSFTVDVVDGNWRSPGDFTLIGYQADGTCLGVRSHPDVWLAPIPGATRTADASR